MTSAPKIGKPASDDPGKPEASPIRVAEVGKLPETSKPAKPPAPEPVTNGQVVARLRRERARRLGFRFALFVLLPTLLSAFYYGLFASDQFESHSVFKVHSAQMRPMLGLEGLLGAVGQPAHLDSMAVRDFVLSRDMLARLDEEQGFIGHYKDPSVDYLSRLDSDASFEEAYEYYLKKIQVDFDSTSGSLVMRARAFSPEKSQAFAKAITEYSEEMVNKLSERERNDQTRYAELEVEKCEKRLVEARKQLLVQQRKHAELNPLQTASSAMAVRTEMEGALAKARAELSAARAFMTPDAPRVVELEAKVNALSGQVATEKNRLVDPKNEKGIAESMAEFEAVFVEKEFAQKSYETAMAALEIARADAARQHRYLAVIATPSQPDESTYPKRALGVLTVFVLAFLLLGIGSLLVAAVREHARV
jgi:capsular polysaccharide transport system permease protein